MSTSALTTEASPASALATAHWGYVESVLMAHGETKDVIAKCGFHYRAAFEHGYKHGRNDPNPTVGS